MDRRTDRRGWARCFALLGALVLAGVGTTLRPGPAQAQPAEPTPQQIFDRVCGRCNHHGEEDVGPSILNKNLAQKRLVKLIRTGTKGRNAMKAIPTTRLSDADLQRMLPYLRQIHAMR